MELKLPLTRKNYFSSVQAIGLDLLKKGFFKNPDYLEVHRDIEETVQELGWQDFDRDDQSKELISAYFKLFNEWLEKEYGTATKPKHVKKAPAKAKSAPKPKVPAKSKPAPKAKRKAKPRKASTPNLRVKLKNRLSDEIRLIRRFVALHGKAVTKKRVLNLIKALEKAVLQKSVRKRSAYSEDIQFVRSKVKSFYNANLKEATANDFITVKIGEETLARLKEIGKGHSQRTSVRLLSRYVNLLSAEPDKAKSSRLLMEMKKAFEKKKISKRDPYYDEIIEAMQSLAKVGHSVADSLAIPDFELNGCGCESLSGAESGSYPAPVPSSEFRREKMDDIHFLDISPSMENVFGKLTDSSTILVWGKRGSGKSTLVLQFAHFFARQGKKLLYISYEEGFSDTAAMILERTGADHSNLHWFDSHKTPLGNYDFIFFDSLEASGFSHPEVIALRDWCKKHRKVLCFINHATQDGKNRGGTLAPHLLDVEILVQDGVAYTQKCRYQSGRISGEHKIKFTSNTI